MNYVALDAFDSCDRHKKSGIISIGEPDDSKKSRGKSSQAG